MKKRLFSLILSLVLVCGLMPAALAAGSMDNFQKVNSDFTGKFTDVDTNAWYIQSVQNAYELGLVQGSSATTFSPDGNITAGCTASTIPARPTSSRGTPGTRSMWTTP